MKQLLSSIIFLTAASTSAAASLLDMRGKSPQLIVDDAPFLILGGELGNSAATCGADIERIFPQLADMNLNTVLVPAYWDLLEPTEGSFDFSLIDKTIHEAKANGMKVVFLWFGAWKNSMSCYAPGWVKEDTRRFPRARTAAGKPLEIASAFSADVLDADRKAFSTFMRHIASSDRDGTVIMVQIENEIGMLEDARDHSTLADAEYKKGVPPQLMEYLDRNKQSLHPSLLKRWDEAGNKKRGTWKEVFGDDILTDEYFMAWNYARYVEELAREARKVTDMPLYVNAALNSRGRRPGEYPSAGPLAHLKDIWHAGAPSVDFLSPDIYDTGFSDWVAQYALPDNVLFIPEVKRENANAARAYYVIGHHDALGISPFAIEQSTPESAAPVVAAYSRLRELTPLISTYRGTDSMDGVLLSADSPESILTDGDTRITLSHYFTLPWDSRAKDKNNWDEAGALLIKLGEGDYILAGTGVVAKFEHTSEVSSKANLGEDGFLNAGSDREKTASVSAKTRVGLKSVEEVSVAPDGSLRRVRTFNGDETHQGRHARISVDDNTILHITTYRYD